MSWVGLGRAAVWATAAVGVLGGVAPYVYLAAQALSAFGGSRHDG